MWADLGVGVGMTSMLADLAEARGLAGRIEEGLAGLADALRVVEKQSEHAWESELYRLRGELLLKRSVPDEREAEACLARAVEIARQQEAKLLELRATASLARLWQRQGRREEARQRLAAIYGWFTEGFDTPDLRDARALLDELTP